MDYRLRDKLYDMTILVVDDNEDNLELISALLEDDGYKNLLRANNGQQAIDILESGEPVDMVLLDINMPILNGYQVLEHLKGHGSLGDIPIIMVSAIDQLDSVIRCIEAGAVDYLTKPVEEALLYARVHASLERKYLRNTEKDLLHQVQEEKRKSERLLYNVLPERVAERLKAGEETIADNIPEATVLFGDIVDFTKLSTKISAEELVSMLNDLFLRFDRLVEKFRLEKIKTIGDAYMIVGGLPPVTRNHAERCLGFAVEAMKEVENYNQENMLQLRLKIGISTGPVLAGVIGHTRFTYDLWGETVNMASRMESLGLPDWIHVTKSTANALKPDFHFEPRGKIEVKGKGVMETFLLSKELLLGKQSYESVRKKTARFMDGKTS